MLACVWAQTNNAATSTDDQEENFCKNNSTI